MKSKEFRGEQDVLDFPPPYRCIRRLFGEYTFISGNAPIFRMIAYGFLDIAAEAPNAQGRTSEYS